MHDLRFMEVHCQHNQMLRDDLVSRDCMDSGGPWIIKELENSCHLLIVNPLQVGNNSSYVLVGIPEWTCCVLNQLYKTYQYSYIR